MAWKDLLKRYAHEVDAFCDSSDGRYVFHFSEIGDLSTLDAIGFLKNNKSLRAFNEDRKWLDWCQYCLLLLPSGKSPHLEAGYAKGKGKRLVIWQEKFPKGEFDVMYGFADLITNDAYEVVKFISEGR